MQLLNEAYAVLSDPEKRKAHDQWIEAEQYERMREHFAKMQSVQPNQKTQQPKTPPPSAPQSKPTNGKVTSKILLALLFPLQVLSHVLRHFLLYVIALIVISVTISALSRGSRSPSPSSYTPRPLASTTVPTPTVAPAPKPPMCVAMPTGPKSAPWPTTAGYLNPEKILGAKGLSTLTVDNTKGSTSIYIKLRRVTGDTIRHVYVPAGQQFKMNQIDPGSYFMSYKDVVNGCNYKSSPFELEEIKMYSGTQYSDFTMTIYKVANGNMNYQTVSEAYF